jgi:hypothetical protein
VDPDFCHNFRSGGLQKDERESERREHVQRLTGSGDLPGMPTFVVTVASR